MPPTLAPGEKFAANGRVLLSDRDRRFEFSRGVAREIEVELDEDPTIRVRMVDWNQEKRHGDPVRVTGTIESVRPWKSGGQDFRTVTLAKGHRMTVRKAEEPPPSLVAPAVPVSADADDLWVDGVWLGF